MEMWIIWKFVISLNQVTAACNLFVLKCSIKWYILIYMYEYIFSFLHKGDESFLALIFGSLFVWCWSVNFLNFDLSSDWLSVRFFIEFSTTCPGQDSTKHVTKHPQGKYLNFLHIFYQLLLQSQFLNNFFTLKVFLGMGKACEFFNKEPETHIKELHFYIMTSGTQRKYFNSMKLSLCLWLLCMHAIPYMFINSMSKTIPILIWFFSLKSNCQLLNRKQTDLQMNKKKLVEFFFYK